MTASRSLMPQATIFWRNPNIVLVLYILYIYPISHHSHIPWYPICFPLGLSLTSPALPSLGPAPFQLPQPLSKISGTDPSKKRLRIHPIPQYPFVASIYIYMMYVYIYIYDIYIWYVYIYVYIYDIYIYMICIYIYMYMYVCSVCVYIVPNICKSPTCTMVSGVVCQL